ELHRRQAVVVVDVSDGRRRWCCRVARLVGRRDGDRVLAGPASRIAGRRRRGDQRTGHGPGPAALRARGRVDGRRAGARHAVASAGSLSARLATEAGLLTASPLRWLSVAVAATEIVSL